MNKDFYLEIKEHLLTNGVNFSQDLSYPSEMHSDLHRLSSIGIFLFPNQICFKDESSILMWLPELASENPGRKVLGNVPIFSLRHRDTRKVTPLSKEEFFMYLDILIEMDILRSERIRLRRLILSNEVRSHHRDKLINEII